MFKGIVWTSGRKIEWTSGETIVWTSGKTQRSLTKNVCTSGKHWGKVNNRGTPK